MILFCRINFNISKDSESKVEKRRVFFSCFSVQSTQITKILWLRNAEISKKKGRNYYRLEKYSLIMVALNCSLLSSFLVFFFFWEPLDSLLSLLRSLLLFIVLRLTSISQLASNNNMVSLFVCLFNQSIFSIIILKRSIHFFFSQDSQNRVVFF